MLRAARVGTRRGPMTRPSQGGAEEAAGGRRERPGTGRPVRVRMMTRSVLLLAVVAAAAVAYLGREPASPEPGPRKQARTTLLGHRGPVRGVAFSPDGTTLASAGS